MSDETTKNPAASTAEESSKSEEKPAEISAEVSQESPVAEVAEESVPATKTTPELRPGYRVRVYQKIQQGDKERIQMFEGIVIAIKGQDAQSRTITVRKIAEGGYGVERIWPVLSPSIEKIEVVERPNVRRSKLYYLRGSLRKMRKLRERA